MERRCGTRKKRDANDVVAFSSIFSEIGHRAYLRFLSFSAENVIVSLSYRELYIFHILHWKCVFVIIVVAVDADAGGSAAVAAAAIIIVPAILYFLYASCYFIRLFTVIFLLHFFLSSFLLLVLQFLYVSKLTICVLMELYNSILNYVEMLYSLLCVCVHQPFNGNEMESTNTVNGKKRKRNVKCLSSFSTSQMVYKAYIYLYLYSFERVYCVDEELFCFYFGFRCYHRNWIAETKLPLILFSSLSVCMFLYRSGPLFMFISFHPRIKCVEDVRV